jgi:hypothetical protein
MAGKSREPDKDTTDDNSTTDTITGADTAPSDRAAVFTPVDALARLTTTFTGPCTVARTPLRPLGLPDPTGIDPKRVEIAGYLMSIYLYGMRLMFFSAVDRARELLDTNDLCLERDAGDKAGVVDQVVDKVAGKVVGDDVRNALYCWPHHYDRVTSTQRATMVARVLGQPHPDVPDELVDTEIVPLLRTLFDAINSVCDPGPFRKQPTPAAVDAVELARESVRYRLSQSVTEMVALQTRDLSDQLETAVAVLTGLASRLASPCRVDLGVDLWASLDRLVGPQLRAEKIDVVSVAQAAQAWQVIFDWLVMDIPGATLEASITPLCGPVSRLQAPRRTGGLDVGCCCGGGTSSAAVP